MKNSGNDKISSDEKKENRRKIKTPLRVYLKWPAWMSILLVIMNISVYPMDLHAGMLVSGFVLVYLIMAGYFIWFYKKHLTKSLVEYGSEYAQIQRKLLNEMDFPYAMTDQSGKIMWMNRQMAGVLGCDCSTRVVLHDVMPEITRAAFQDKGTEIQTEVNFNNHCYQVHTKHLELSDNMKNISFEHPEEGALYAVYLIDDTEILQCKKEIHDNRLVAGLIYLDNCEEVLERVDDARKSLVIAFVDRKINQYFAKYHCIIKKMERDKYLFVVPQKALEDMKSGNFQITEDVKTVSAGNEMAITLSMGIGFYGDDFSQNYEYARDAIDLALGRGGDQVVLKSKNDVEYYGGKTHSMEKTTRVRARVKAHALREIIEAKDNVLIMGHHLSDVDSIGAAVGVYRAARYSQKKAYIVLDNVIESIKPLLERFKEIPDYGEELFVTGDRAKELAGQNTIVVLVDVNRPSYSECPDLLKKTKNIVILDHHRQSTEKVENPVLSYIETYASSACELVAEILQYYAEDLKITALEADAMYAGIMVDTDHFRGKTGIRTFEAAAYLRRSGADVVRIRKLFRDDMDDYRVRANAVRRAEVYMGCFAISECEGICKESLSVIAAQAANELLNIKGIQASFVLAFFEGKIYISARSIDEVNVQRIMEKLGGGGHMSIAGAQLENVTMAEAKLKLKDVIRELRDAEQI